MVSRSIGQRLLEWVRTNTLGGAEQTEDPTDQALMAQAIQDPAQAQNLIAIERARAENTLQLETARGQMRLRMAARLGLIGLGALLIVVAAVAFVLNRAASLRLSLPAAGTGSLTVAGTMLLSALAWWGKRAHTRRRSARTNEGNPPENHTEGDQNPVGAP